MKKPFVMGLLLALGAMGVMSQAYAADQVKSLRGASDLDASSNKVLIKRVQQGREPIARDYVQQPPLIPHQVEGYKINVNFNNCLILSWLGKL